MKVVVVSDSHTENEFDYTSKYDFKIHAGDSQVYDEVELFNYFDVCVKGNTDFIKLDKEKIFKLGQLDVAVTHGHLHDVNYDDSMIYNSYDYCDVIIHGHTHVVKHYKYSNTLILNPGSTRQSRSKYPETFMVLTINKRNVKVEVVNYKTKEVIEKAEYNL